MSYQKKNKNTLGYGQKGLSFLLSGASQAISSLCYSLGCTLIMIDSATERSNLDVILQGEKKTITIKLS